MQTVLASSQSTGTIYATRYSAARYNIAHLRAKLLEYMHGTDCLVLHPQINLDAEFQ